MRLIENNLNVITFQLYECDLFFMTLDEVSNYVFIAHLNPLKKIPTISNNLLFKFMQV